MSLPNITGLDATALRQKRGSRKKWLTKGDKLKADFKDTIMEELHLNTIKRARDQTTTQRDEYHHIQSHLVELLDEMEPRSEDNYQVEVDDLDKHMAKFEELIDDFELLIIQKNLMTQIQRDTRDTYAHLVALNREADFSHVDVHHRLNQVANEVEAVGKIRSQIDEVHLVRIEASITELSSILQPLLLKERAHRPDSSPSAGIGISAVSTAPATGSAPATAHQPQSRLPMHKIPTFHGDPMKWEIFLKTFSTIMDHDKRLTESDKLSYLREAIKTPEAEREFSALTGRDGEYDSLIKRFISLYHDPRLVFRNLIQELIDNKAVGIAGAEDWFRKCTNNWAALQKSKQYDAHHIMAIIFEIKFDGKLLDEWITAEGKLRVTPDPTVVLGFLEDTSRKERQMAAGRKAKLRTNVTVQPFKPKKATVLFTQPAESTPPAPPPSAKPASKQRAPCKLCGIDRHPMFACDTFKSMSVPQRKDVVTKFSLCSNCLGYNHTPTQCRSTRTCRECSQAHHSSLHEPTPTTSPVPNRITLLATSTSSEGTMPTAVVLLEVQGRMVKARAVLDSCSTKSFITKSMVQQLRATSNYCPSTALGVGMIDGLYSSSRTSFVLHPRNSAQRPPFLLEAGITQDISVDLPFSFLHAAKDLPFLSGLDLADPSFSSPGRIDLLLGLQGTGAMATKGIVENFISDDGIYQATSTIYGWVVQGWKQTDTSPESTATVLMTQDKPPAEDLSQFWKIEGHNEADKTMTKDDTLALQHFEETVTTDESTGRYVVQLPRKIPTPVLGNSRPQAEKRYHQNKRSLEKRNQWTTFCSAVSEYEELDHAERVPAADLLKPANDCFYLPMHGVAKASSTSTKLRIVFDASARSSNGISLNDTLLPGPNMYPLITDVLLKFRTHKIGMTADISKMFREISLHPKDRDLHRFLHMDRDNTLEVWRMKRVTFGVTSSPFLATQALLQLATEVEAENPEVAHIIRNEFYVDDCVTGADSVEEGAEKRVNVCNVLSKRGFHLRKWRSDSAELLATIPTELREEELATITLTPQNTIKILGVHWNPPLDQMFVSTPTLTTDRTPTKRQVSSDLARTYDVLGWYAPAMVLAKLIIQELWILGLGWDEQVPENVADRWRQWTSELPLINSHPINRCHYDKTKTRISQQLHGFCDASEKAYGGTVYLRTFHDDTTTTTALLMSKTRVSPIKPLTIPKLELCGAELLSQLLKTIQATLQISPDMTYAWTDSTVVLGWLNHDPGRLKTFVANRVARIVKIVEPSKWRYVSTNLNPADAASRGMMPQDLINHSLWWNGPEWLLGDPRNWPQYPGPKKVTLPEVKLDLTLFTTSPPEPLNLLKRYSSHHRLRRTTAWIKRFYYNLRHKQDNDRRLLPRLTTEELAEADITLCKIVQSEHYSVELESLSAKRVISPKSSILRLSPFLDQQGLLRVGGRLENSLLPYSAKHPVILPRQSTLAKLIISQLHLDNRHVGVSTLIALVAENYHITGIRTAARSITRQCVICRKSSAQKAQQMMGQLPAYRTTVARVFSQVGTDFAGPFILKSGNPRRPRRTKAFLCLFICMATKAVHLELVSDMTSAAFLAAFGRFCGRRGPPHTVYSDNGSNYVGARKELEEAYDMLTQLDSADHIQRGLANIKVRWKHTPARAPHFGGLWESTVKAVKSLLKKTIGLNPLNYEEYLTVFADIEAILNSRPLIPLNAQPVDGVLALTPGHFLTGTSLRTVPDLQSVKPVSSRKRWNHCQSMSQNFWEQWTNSYLITLNKRNKWLRPHRNIKQGDIVLIKDVDLFMTVWPLAIVTETHPGADGLVRAVTVRTSKGEYRRPVVKLVLLLSDESDETEEQDSSSSSPGRMDAPTGHSST